MEDLENVFENVENYTIDIISSPVTRENFLFYQRVFSETQGWCYYSTRGSTNSEPLQNQTEPTHQNDISGHQLIAIVEYTV
jgi:hypothetical protein